MGAYVVILMYLGSTYDATRCLMENQRAAFDMDFWMRYT